MKRSLALSFLTLASLAAGAAEAPPSTMALTVTITQSPPPHTLPAARKTTDANPQYRTRWLVSLDAAGHVAKIEAGDKTLIDAVRMPLGEAIRRWQFVPGMLDGKPAPTDTTLTVDISLVPQGEDKYAVRVDDARTGGDVPVQGIRKAPKYPPAAIQHHRQGMVVLKVDYDASGHVVAANMHENAPAVAPELAKSAQQAVKAWIFAPEVVGGHPLAGSAIVPICFEIFPSGTLRPRHMNCAWTPPGSQSTLHDADVLAIEPAAKLQTDVVGHTL